MIERIEQARQDKDTLGGIFEVVVAGVPPGLGTYTQWNRRLDARLVHALVSIPAVKGAEVGQAVANSALPGSRVHDEIFRRDGDEPVPGRPDHVGPYYRKTNRAGGVEGGMSNASAICLSLLLPLTATCRKTRSRSKLKCASSSATAEQNASPLSSLFFPMFHQPAFSLFLRAGLPRRHHCPLLV